MSKVAKLNRIYKWFAVLVVMPVVALASTSNPIEDKTLTQKQLEKKVLEEAAAKWPNLSGKNLRNHVAVLYNTPLYDNSKVADYVQRVGEKVLQQTPHAGKEYRFLVLDDPNPNAFTMQQPYIYVNRGLITLYQNEAQLAGVLAHEIGHNIDKGVSKRRRKGIFDSIFATSMSILAGSSGVGNAISAQQQINQAEYSRERELEADRLGALYMHGAGYNTEGLVDGLGSLFDYTKASIAKSTVPYRTLQTHPRNDKRLRAVLRGVGNLPPGEEFEGRSEYRDMLEDVVFGKNLRPTAPVGWVRYNNERLGITLLHPATWDRKIKGSKIVIQNPEKTMQFKVEIEKTGTNTKTSSESIKEKYSEGLDRVVKIHPKEEKDLGAMGVKNSQRVALSRVARNTFHFTGLTRDSNLTPERDKQFVSMIRSFRRMQPNDKNLAEVQTIYFEQLEPGQTFGSIANDKTDENVANESQLRAINGYFPRGEAEPGTWIKKIRIKKVDQNDYNAKATKS